MADNKEIGNKFWTILRHDKGVTVTIHPEKLIDFCSRCLCFYNYKNYSGTYQLVKIERNSIIKEARLEDLKQSIKHYLRVIVEEEDVWAEFLKFNIINDHFLSLIDLLPPIKFNLSKKDEAIFFYKNGVVTLKMGNPPSITPYEQFKGIVWEEQISPREFTKPDSNFQNSVFNKFLRNVTGDKDRYLSLFSIIGYMLHPFKNHSFSKAVILLDKRAGTDGSANGGTGKSIIARAMGRITSLVEKDARLFNGKDNFAFDDVRQYHRILYFDDVKSDFSLEDYYSFITGDFIAKRKYKDSQKIPFELSPKLLITSNYMVHGAEGDTDRRRRIEFELNPYYSADFSPALEFGHTFFTDWDESEWLLFDTLMLYSVYYYMKHGIIICHSDSLKENKLKIRTHHEFVDFADSNIEMNRSYVKNDLLELLQSNCPELKYVSSNRFKKWLDIWSSARGFQIHHSKSNGNALVKFLNLKEGN